jgi:uncharacterized protein
MSGTRFLQIRVKPNAGVSDLSAQEDGSWLARLKSAPVDGKANAELTALIAKQFACPKKSVRIKSGAGARLKLVQLELP